MIGVMNSTKETGYLCALASLAVLAGALYFQYVHGLPPCPLCLWQRWPHAVAVVVALTRLRLLLPLIYAISTTLAGFHMGIEYGWWEGFSTCGSAIQATTSQELLAALRAAPPVRCDAIAWTWGLSLAGWNMLISMGLTIISGISLACHRRKHRKPTP